MKYIVDLGFTEYFHCLLLDFGITDPEAIANAKRIDKELSKLCTTIICNNKYFITDDEEKAKAVSQEAKRIVISWWNILNHSVPLAISFPIMAE
jgi:hypothetical protein